MTLFSWGSNRDGQLGHEGQPMMHQRHHPNSNNCPTPMEVMELGRLGVNIRAVAAGAAHSLAVTEFGDVYAWGRNKEGACGNGTTTERVTLEKVESLAHETIVDVSAGFNYSMAVSATGVLYTWGLVHQCQEEAEMEGMVAGQLAGMYNPNESLTQKIARESTERWLMAQEDEDDDLSDGSSSPREDGEHREYHGILRMHTHRTVQPLPCRVPSLAGVFVVKVCAGYGHALALSRDGRLYSHGYNDRGALGLGHRVNVSDFREITALRDWVVMTMCCGSSHNLAIAVPRDSAAPKFIPSAIDEEARSLLPPGSLFVWGNSTLGQLGVGTYGTYRARLKPQLLSTLKDVIDVSAGENNSVAVTSDGGVWVWGSGSYNEHGTGAVAGHDLVDRLYYYSPRRVMHLPHGLKIARVVCGSSFTLAVSTEGDLWSWGWAAHGCLGRPFGHSSLTPDMVHGIRMVCRSRGYSIRSLAAGSQHCLAVLQPPDGATFVPHLLPMLENSYMVDVGLKVGEEIIPAHRAILSARSSYLHGYLVKSLDASDHSQPFPVIELWAPRLTSVILRAVLVYLYTDKLQVPSHRVPDLFVVAKTWCLDRLACLCLAMLPYRESKENQQDDGNGSTKGTPPSTFVKDVLSLLGDEQAPWADLRFVFKYHGQKYPAVPTHRALLCWVDYFRGLLEGGFRESSNSVLSSDGKTKDVDLSELLQDPEGMMDFHTFMAILRFVYSGCGWSALSFVEDMNQVMQLLVVSDRLGLKYLAQFCERRIMQHLPDFPENAINCLDFATQFHIPRLKTQCEILVGMSRYDHPFKHDGGHAMDTDMDIDEGVEYKLSCP